MILAGDIGGTTTRLALFEAEEGTVKPRIESDYPSREYPGLETILTEFLDRNRHPIAAACFGIAGPVRQDRIETPNLSWVVDAKQLAHHLHRDEVILLNDLEATAHGVLALGEGDFAVLNQGHSVKDGNRAIIAAGTGLGEAALFWDGKAHRPSASEGGHADFAPRNELEMELLPFLAREFDHVSYERVVSGPGLYRLYRFLRDTRRGEEPEWLAERLAREDPPAVIAAAALEGTSELCRSALDLFVSLYGAEAGNLALKLLATGGVYLGGGIAPKILPKLKEPLFMESFQAKGRYRELLQAIPVRVVLNDRAALLGAARHAAMTAGLIHG
jgi:glucokinase